MKTIRGSGEIPVIYSAHHASHDFGEFAGRVALTDEQRVRFSDYGTAESVPLNGLYSLIAEHSRALGDLNRNPDDPGRFQSQDYGKPSRRDIWLPGQELTEAEKAYCQTNFHDPYHERIVELLAGRDGLTFVVAWDNTAHYEIGQNEAGETVIMKPIVISNRGKEGSSGTTENEQTSCDPYFMDCLADALSQELKARGLPSEVYLNLVFRGGYICRRYSTLRNTQELNSLGIKTTVQSLQIEYDTAITHDQQTLEPKPDNIEALRAAAEVAMARAYQQYVEYHT